MWNPFLGTSAIGIRAGRVPVFFTGRCAGASGIECIPSKTGFGRFAIQSDCFVGKVSERNDDQPKAITDRVHANLSAS